MASAGRLIAKLQVAGDKNWGYEGAGVKLGEKNKIVFWHKQGEHGRAIYGDLNAYDIAIDQKKETIKPD